MTEQRNRRLAFAWHVAEFVLSAIGLGWSAYHLLRPQLVSIQRLDGGLR